MTLDTVESFMSRCDAISGARAASRFRGVKRKRHIVDLGSMTDKFSEAGQKVVRRAIELSKSHDHNFLSLAHLFAALVEVESELFVETMQAVGIDPHSVRACSNRNWPKALFTMGRKMAIPEPTRDLFNRALRRARSQGRQAESYDLFAGLFTDQSGAPQDSAAAGRRPRRRHRDDLSARQQPRPKNEVLENAVIQFFQAHGGFS